jgi:hypothetical protein
VNGYDSYPNCDQLSNTTNMTNILIFFAAGFFHLPGMVIPIYAR